MEAKQYNPSHTIVSTKLINEISTKLAYEMHEEQNKRDAIDSEGNPVFDVMRAVLAHLGHALKREHEK